MDRITVLIASDQVDFLKELQVVLAQQTDIEVVGEAAAQGSQVLRMAEALQPDILVWDMPLFHPGGMEIFREAQAKSPRTKILIVSELCSVELITSALHYGIKGCLPRTPAPGLFKAIRVIHSGDLWFQRRLLAQALTGVLLRFDGQHKPFLGPLENLTNREQEIIRWLRQGMMNKEIARRLDISDKTVKKHVSRIFQKLGG